MARLFITEREVDFINDITKEVIKDVIGQRVYLYTISEVKSNVHDVYLESPEKVFDNPIILDCLVEWEPEDVRTGKFGTEEYTNITAFVSARDMIDRKIRVSEGDFFSYGTQFFEITSARDTHNIYGQIEYTGGMKLTGRESRKGNFITKVLGPTDEKYTDPDAVQKQFIQQRGFSQTGEGKTGDKRALQDRGVLDAPLTGPSTITVKSTLTGSAGSSFYDEQ